MPFSKNMMTCAFVCASVAYAVMNILWFRRDLRLGDNPALCEAVRRGALLPLYIWDDSAAGREMGSASRLWLYHSLRAFNESLVRMGGRLHFYRGEPRKILRALATKHGIKEIFCNHCYEPSLLARDATLKETLAQRGIKMRCFNGSMLWQRDDITKPDGTPYRIFTPFYHKGCLKATAPRSPLATPAKIDFIQDDSSLSLNDLALLPSHVAMWGAGVMSHWHTGEAGGRKMLTRFIQEGLAPYKQGRDFPAQPHVSRLAPYLHFGELSPHILWHEAKQRKQEAFCRQLGWREFCAHLLYFNPSLPHQNLQAKFDNFGWRRNDDEFKRWCRGATGIPFVDAGMRELWQTGYMHNRLRMVVASFLVKNLMIDWRYGEAWFWECLLDADEANNSANWQWVAGCGADAAPFFRIFNPVLQGQKFDKEGAYTRHYVPELKDVPARYLFNPWDAPAPILANAGVELGVDYPHPMVELQASRTRALNAFRTLHDPP